MRVGFIGLGNMGAPMASFVRRAGFSLVVHDLRRSAAAGVLEGAFDVTTQINRKVEQEAHELAFGPPR